MLRHGVMVPYHEDAGFTTEIIGVHTVHASVTFKFDPVEMILFNFYILINNGGHYLTVSWI